MVKKILAVLFFVVGLLFAGYLLLPSPGYPEPMEGFAQSFEPADVETSLRRGYFNNSTREEVLSYYSGAFDQPTLGNMKFLSYRLNYPPEEAQMLIRDQTQSYYLEEIVHPFRESLYVNGYVVHGPDEQLSYKGVPYEQKNIIKYVSSSVIARLLFGLGGLGALWVVGDKFGGEMGRFLKVTRRK